MVDEVINAVTIEVVTIGDVVTNGDVVIIGVVVIGVGGVGGGVRTASGSHIRSALLEKATSAM